MLRTPVRALRARCAATRCSRLRCASLLSLLLLASTSARASAAELRIDAGEALAAVEIDSGNGAVSELDRAALEHAVDRLGLTLSWDAPASVRPGGASHETFVAGTQERESGADYFYENDYAEAVSWLTPWLEALREDPSALAHHPDLAPGALYSMIALVRAHEALGDSAAVRATLADVVRVFWGTNPGDAMPPATARAYQEARDLTTTREVELDLRGADSSCVLFANGLAIGAPPKALAIPDAPVFLSLRCEGGDSAIHAVPADRSALRIDLAYDDAARAGRTLAPRATSPAHVARVVSQHAWAARASAGLSVGLVRSDLDVDFVEIVVAEAEGERYRAARIAPGAPASAWEAALRFVARGEPAPSDVVAWTGDGSWSGLIDARGRRWTWASAGVLVAASSTAAILQVRDSRARRALDECAQPTSSCVFEGRLPERRRARVHARRDAAIAWSITGAAALGTLVAAMLESERAPRDAAFALAPSPAGAELRVQF